MHWIIYFAIAGCVFVLAGAIWFTHSMITLVRSLEDTEESTRFMPAASGRTFERAQTSWARSAFTEMAEWNADMHGGDLSQTMLERANPSWLHWSSRTLFASGILLSGGSILLSISASYIPTLMKLLDPVFDGVVNNNLGLMPVAEVSAVAGLVGGSLAWLENQKLSRQ